MLKIKENYEDVTIEYSLNGVRVTKKLKDITEQEIESAEKCGVHLAKYFEKTELNIEFSNELPTINYKAIEVEQPELQAVTFEKPKRKRK
jgi:hypothetical protein